MLVFKRIYYLMTSCQPPNPQTMVRHGEGRTVPLHSSRHCKLPINHGRSVGASSNAAPSPCRLHHKTAAKNQKRKT
jgi:hypothetical protein